MLQLPRVVWRLLACKNGAFPDCIIVVVVSDACSEMGCVGHKSSRLIGNPETPGLDSEEEAEKCRTERRAVHHQASQPREARKSSVQFSKCELCNILKTEHASPFCMRTEKNTSGSESTSP